MDAKEIRETFEEIFNRFREIKPTEKTKVKALQDSFAKLCSNLDQDARPIERLYFCYLIAQLFNRTDLEQQSLVDFVRILFPAILNKRQAALVSDLISLALTLCDTRLLDCLEFYVKNCDSITFPKVQLPTSLARDSPSFCSATISRGYFQSSQQDSVDKEQLSRTLTGWLQTLVDLVPDSTINLNRALRFAFLDRPADYELHHALLSVIRFKKCEQLNNQFIIDLATSIANLPATTSSSTTSEVPAKSILVDRFAQLLIIAYSTESCSQSNQLKSMLLNKFPDSNLMKAVCK